MTTYWDHLWVDDPTDVKNECDGDGKNSNVLIR